MELDQQSGKYPSMYGVYDEDVRSTANLVASDAVWSAATAVKISEYSQFYDHILVGMENHLSIGSLQLAIVSIN